MNDSGDVKQQIGHFPVQSMHAVAAFMIGHHSGMNPTMAFRPIVL